MIKLLALLIAFRISKQIRENYIKKCVGCGAELDIEDYFINNSCEYCVNSELNNCMVLKNV